MAVVLDFKDNDRACWARLKMDDGSPIHIKVASTGVSVKKSIVGSMGPKIYWQTNRDKVAMTCSDLSKRYAKDCTPTEINSPVSQFQKSRV